MSDEIRKVSRRKAIAGAAAAAGALLLEKSPLPAQPAHPAPQEPWTAPGSGTTAQSARSAFENPARTPTGVQTGSSYTPLQDLTGSITPNDLVFERHHSGIPVIDPARHTVLIHGLVERPMKFTVADLRRMPNVSRVHFLECSGNGRSAYRSPKPEMTAQMVDGLTSNGEWTGVPLGAVLREAGIRPAATWFVAEGADSNKLSRSVPMEKALDDALLAWAFNGEPLRPSNGYPVRLFLPGYEGNTNVKWLRRIELTDRPNMSKDETSKYTDPLPDGTARQFSFVMDAKSIITTPSHPMTLGRGWLEISGLAWSGRGRITRVEVTTDGGRTWADATLQAPALPKAHTRFCFMWNRRGGDALIASRATDETGAVQPDRATYEATRGRGTDYHFNAIRTWKVASDGTVTFAG